MTGNWPAQLGKLATVTTSSAPTLGKHNSYSAAAGALVPVLPALTTGAVAAAVAAGQVVRVKVSKSKTDTTANTITLTTTNPDTFEGGTTTLALVAPGEKVTLAAQSVPGGTGTVWVVEEHTAPRDSLDKRYPRFGRTPRLPSVVSPRDLLVPGAPFAQRTANQPPIATLGATSSTGGTFTAGAYFWVVGSVDANGNESPSSNSVTATLAANGTQILNWAAVSGAAAYKVYRGTYFGGEDNLIATLGNVLTYTDTGATGTAVKPPLRERYAPNTLSPNITITAANLLVNGMATFARAGNFVTVGSGKSPTYRTPRSASGREGFTMQHGYDGSRVVYSITSAPGAIWRLQVDGVYVNLNTNVGLGGGANTMLDFTFPDARPRRLRLDLKGCDLVSAIVQPTATMWALRPRGPRCIIIGDSYTDGAGGNPPVGFNGLTSWAWQFADQLGWEDVWQSGIGGTGWIQRNSGQTNNYEDRIASDVVAFAPDVVVLWGGRNDYNAGSPAQIGAAAGRSVTAIRAGLPNALIVVIGPDGSAMPVDGTADTTWKPMQDAIFAAVTAAVPDAILIDTCVPGWLTGTGKAGTATGSGNGDIYVQSDAVHPTQLGADYLGRRVAEGVLAALGAA